MDRGLSKCQRYYGSLCSKLVNEGRRGVKHSQNPVNVVYKWPLRQNIPMSLSCAIVSSFFDMINSWIRKYVSVLNDNLTLEHNCRANSIQEPTFIHNHKNDKMSKKRTVEWYLDSERQLRGNPWTTLTSRGEALRFSTPPPIFFVNFSSFFNGSRFKYIERQCNICWKLFSVLTVARGEGVV